MSTGDPDSGQSPTGGYLELVQTLQDTHRRLQELTGGEVDAVLGPAGTPLLLTDAQSRLRASEAAQRRLAERLTATLESITDAFFTLDRDFRFTYVNGEAERVLGRSRDDLLARVIRDIEGLNDETFTEAFQRAFDLQAAVSFEARFHPPGLWLDVRAYPAPDGLTVYLRDTTERHRERRRLEFLETAVARLNDVVVITEADPSTGRGSRIVFVNEAFERVTGYSPESVLGRVTWDLLGPRISDESRARIRAALERGESAGEELLSHTRNGEPYWVELRVVPLLGPGGRPTHFVAVMRDVSDRKRAQLARERSNRALRLLSRCNRAVIRAADERRLLDTVCRLAIEIGGYLVAWVGTVDDPAAEGAQPVAWHAAGDGGLDEDAIHALHAGEHPVSGALGTDHVVACLPLRSGGRNLAVLGLVTTTARPLEAEELQLLGELADNLAFGIESLRTREREDRLQDAVFRIAAAVSARTGHEFFERLVRTMTEVLGADAGYIARCLPEDPSRVYSVAGHCDGRPAEPLSYALGGTPCAVNLEQSYCVVTDRVAERFPEDTLLADMGARGYVGERLGNTAGENLGVLYVIYRRPVQDPEFVSSTLRIFAAGAAAELERLEADSRIREQAMLLEHTRDAILLTDARDRIRYWNRGAEQTYGWSASEVIGRSAAEVLRVPPDAYGDARGRVREEGYWSGELDQHTRGGRHIVVESHWSLAGEDSGGSVLQIGSDITQRKASERRIQQLAFYDEITGLPNRALFMDRLTVSLAGLRRGGSSLALLFLDLNRFKEINDRQGHAAGDRVLVEVAQRFRNTLRANETLARLGGDEFVVIAEDADEAAATRIAERLVDALGQPLTVDGRSIPVEVSIGIALAPRDGDTADELLMHTDIAMYRAKRGSIEYSVYEPHMSRELDDFLSLAERLDQALKNDVLQLYYQPQVALDTGELIGAEVLLRWYDEDWGWVNPGRAVSTAEERRMMGRLGDWVMRTACGQLAQWRSRGVALPPELSINVSAQQLEHAGVAEQFARHARGAGLAASAIRLELTETAIASDPDHAVEITVALREAGFTLCIDDFGTGYSSLAYLKRFPVDMLKIDLSFVRDMLVSESDHAIVATIIAMARNLGLTTLAEGVEEAEQARALASLGCEFAQGYYYGRPMPADEFARAWLR
ncbi:hypothetical protein KBTX_02923 [wastewater metagenome]|uniref:Uncharacterized protein n=5 Tax=root TaxID=1 RepID=A0A5B8RF15_9ZZZZ|nr:hypothetical protein KBTEX_02923 [uncultured organism]